jgi:hypothetical protein
VGRRFTRSALVGDQAFHSSPCPITGNEPIALLVGMPELESSHRFWQPPSEAKELWDDSFTSSVSWYAAIRETDDTDLAK